MYPDAASAEDLMRDESWGPPYQVYHSVYVHKPRFKPNYCRIWYQRAQMQRFSGSTVELMLIQCRMYLDAASAEDLMRVLRAEDRHIKSITVCLSANCGSSPPIVAYVIRDLKCNDSQDLQSNSCRYSVVCTLLRPHLPSLYELRIVIFSLSQCVRV